ncbi:MAG: transglycosylase domain-containing protein [Spirochaetia bacterium]
MALFVAVTVGIATGFALAAVYSIPDLDKYGNQTTALPSQILDRNGNLITEFFSDENRDIVSIDELPRHLIYALITREDRYFFEHGGFSFQGTARAAWNLVTNNYVSGGSTLTQQLAGHLYADRNEFSVQRKLRELWWALQIERHWTKYEILEKYLNTMFFGHGNYGVETASQYYFGHSARDLSVAESAMLVIQLANPSLYSPIRRPNNARAMQQRILDQMVENGYSTEDDVDVAFEQYCNTYDFTRSNTSTA